MRTSRAEPAEARPASRVVTLPNAISLLRLCTVPVFVWLFVSGREGLAVLIYGVGASTDWLDGYLARRTGAITELGKLLDPLADRVFIVALAIALVARDLLPLWLAATIVARDLVVLIAFPILERRGMPRIPVSFVGKTATACLLVGLTFLALAATGLDALGEVGRPVGLAFTGSGATLYWIAGLLYARSAWRARDVASRGASPEEAKEP